MILTFKGSRSNRRREDNHRRIHVSVGSGCISKKDISKKKKKRNHRRIHVSVKIEKMYT